MSAFRIKSNLCAVILSFSAVLVGAQEGRVTVRVLDYDTGVPITNAQVSAGFDTNIKPGWGWGSGKPNRVTGLTDTNGISVLDGKGDGGSVGIAVVNTAGYYGSSGYQVLFTNVAGVVNKKWQPWNPTVEIRLKRIGNPIPMYAKRVWNVSLPEIGKPLGFDLMIGDWIAPHGRGLKADWSIAFLTNPESVYTNWYGTSPRVHPVLDYGINISFPNEKAGVVPVIIPQRGGGSALRLSREAPESAYMPVIQKCIVEDQRGLHSDICENQNYYFRVRTKMDDKGNITSALYGKIHGDFQFDHRGRVTFTYYLNPTPNDRNVEFDPKQNLFKNLSSLEKVREP